MRFIDEIRANRLEPRLVGLSDDAPNPKPTDDCMIYLDAFERIVKGEIPVVEAEEAEAFYYARHVAKENPGPVHLREDFINQAPPYPLFWLEWATFMYEENYSKVGCLIQSRPDGNGYEMSYHSFFRIRGAREYAMLPVIICNTSDSDGLVTESYQSRLRGDLDFEKGVAKLPITLPVAMTAVMLMNCSNIKIIKADPTVSEQKLFKLKYKSKRMAQDVRLIQVAGMRELIRRKRAGAPVEHLTEIAAQARRGHFKTYTEEGKLFGRHTGTYFWSSLVCEGKAPIYKMVASPLS